MHSLNLKKYGVESNFGSFFFAGFRGSTAKLMDTRQANPRYAATRKSNIRSSEKFRSDDSH